MRNRRQKLLGLFDLNDGESQIVRLYRDWRAFPERRDQDGWNVGLVDMRAVFCYYADIPRRRMPKTAYEFVSVEERALLDLLAVDRPDGTPSHVINACRQALRKAGLRPRKTAAIPRRGEDYLRRRIAHSYASMSAAV